MGIISFQFPCKSRGQSEKLMHFRFFYSMRFKTLVYYTKNFKQGHRCYVFVENTFALIIGSQNLKISLWKESLMCASQQFHKYQPNEQSPLSYTHSTQSKFLEFLYLKVNLYRKQKEMSVYVLSCNSIFIK